MYAKNFSGKEEWVPGMISKVQGPDERRVVHRHVDHVKARETDNA